MSEPTSSPHSDTESENVDSKDGWSAHTLSNIDDIDTDEPDEEESNLESYRKKARTEQSSPTDTQTLAEDIGLTIERSVHRTHSIRLTKSNPEISNTVLPADTITCLCPFVANNNDEILYVGYNSGRIIMLTNGVQTRCFLGHSCGSSHGVQHVVFCERLNILISIRTYRQSKDMIEIFDTTAHMLHGKSDVIYAEGYFIVRHGHSFNIRSISLHSTSGLLAYAAGFSIIATYQITRSIQAGQPKFRLESVGKFKLGIYGRVNKVTVQPDGTVLVVFGVNKPHAKHAWSGTYCAIVTTEGCLLSLFIAERHLLHEDAVIPAIIDGQSCVLSFNKRLILRTKNMHGNIISETEGLPNEEARVAIPPFFSHTANVKHRMKSDPRNVFFINCEMLQLLDRKTHLAHSVLFIDYFMGGLVQDVACFESGRVYYAQQTHLYLVHPQPRHASLHLPAITEFRESINPRLLTERTRREKMREYLARRYKVDWSDQTPHIFHPSILAPVFRVILCNERLKTMPSVPFLPMQLVLSVVDFLVASLFKPRRIL
jgi:hypothetical protein